MKVPMVAMFFLRFAVSGPRPCGLDGDRQPGGDRWRTPLAGAGRHRRNFLVPRGMAVPAPTGEESCDDAVAPKRSRRRRPSGRSAHHQRPFGRGLGQTGRGDQGDPEGPAGKTGLASQAMRNHRPIRHACASPCPVASRHSPTHQILIRSPLAEQLTILERPGRAWATTLVDLGCSLHHLCPTR